MHTHARTRTRTHTHTHAHTHTHTPSQIHLLFNDDIFIILCQPMPCNWYIENHVTCSRLYGSLLMKDPLLMIVFLQVSSTSTN